jgi:hypothetical protein
MEMKSHKNKKSTTYVHCCHHFFASLDEIDDCGIGFQKSQQKRNIIMRS